MRNNLIMECLSKLIECEWAYIYNTSISTKEMEDLSRQALYDLSRKLKPKYETKLRYLTTFQGENLHT